MGFFGNFLDVEFQEGCCRRCCYWNFKLVYDRKLSPIKWSIIVRALLSLVHTPLLSLALHLSLSLSLSPTHPPTHTHTHPHTLSHRRTYSTLTFSASHGLVNKECWERGKPNDIFFFDNNSFLFHIFAATLSTFHLDLFQLKQMEKVLNKNDEKIAHIGN